MTLEQRVLRLERSCRQWRLACAAALLGAFVMGAAPKSPPPGDGDFANLTANHLTIRNPAGGPALEITADEKQTSLQINNPPVGTSAILVVGKEGANLFLNRITAKGAVNASVGVDDVSGGIALKNADGKTKDLEP
jgi:hypothetical protein